MFPRQPPPLINRAASGVSRIRQRPNTSKGWAMRKSG